MGLGLVIAGLIFAPVAYFFIDSVPLAATGISAMIIGFTSLALARSRPFISPEASELMMRAGMENILAVLEEFGIENRAIYLPSSMPGGQSQAVIPLKDKIELDRIKLEVPGRLFLRYRDDLENVAIAVTTPGNIKLDGIEIKTEMTPSEIESTMTHVLVGLLDLANSVAFSMVGDKIEVVVNRARLQYENNRYYRCLGSPIASIVAGIASESLGKPVHFIDENFERSKDRILLEVLS